MELHERLEIPPERLGGLGRPAALLLDWYHQNKREMPWRGTDTFTPTPYQVWVSEIMLQQTRVEAVRGYYSRFISQLPDVAALAAAPEDQLLKLWEGLGYYNRVRNMQKAARVVMEQHGSALPADYHALQQLPGIGVYTAGAIASIAFGIPVPAPDGNVYRVLTRLLGSSAGLGDSKVKKALAQVAASMIPPKAPGDFNQALMELGAIVCLPNGAPLCNACPWSNLCVARRESIWQTIPLLPEKKPRRVEERTILLIASGGKLLLSRRPAKGLLAGLPEPLNLEGYREPEQVAACVEEMGGRAQGLHPLGKATHIFSHVEWQMEGFSASSPLFDPPPGFFWATAADLKETVALPSAFRAFWGEVDTLLQNSLPQG